jgi:glycosyltransferase involved in cell wall biosynthesis
MSTLTGFQASFKENAISSIPTNLKISVISPFFNEAGNIENYISSLNKYFVDKPYSAEIILVDDGSSDNSIELLKDQPYGNYNIKLVKLSKNFGAQAAVRAGIKHSTGDYITFLPADLQDPLDLIDRSLEKVLEKNADIVYAFRKTTNNSFFESTFSKFYSYMMRKFVNANFPGKGFDIVFFNKKVKYNLDQNIELNSSIQLQILTLGYVSESIYYDKQERKVGKSKWTFSKKMKLFIDSFVAFSFAPIRLVSMVGISFFIIGVFWTAYIILRKLIYDDLASGWPALMSILTIGFGITNISLGIIAEYLWRTLDASRKRPLFIIDEVIELKQP